MPDWPINLSSPGANPATIRALKSGAIKWCMRPRCWWSQRVRRRDFTGVGATTQALALNTLFPKNRFPRNVDLLEGHQIQIIALAAGTAITAASLRLGDLGDNDGLVTSSPILGGGAAVGQILQTPGAAQYANRPEDDFGPLLTVDTTGGFTSALTVFDVEVHICWTPRSEV